MKSEDTITKSEFREAIIAKVKESADYAVKEGLAVTPNDESFSISILDEFVEVAAVIPESTRVILIGLMVVFELRRRNEMAKSGMH